jgi:truncated hemoglobin YjbI
MADTGTSNPTYNLMSVVYHALQGAETIDKYMADADPELSQFLQQVKGGYIKAAEGGKQMLKQRLQQEG